MQEREKKILQLFLDHKNQVFTSSELAFIFNISSRTIKSDIKRINSELSSTGLRIVTKAGLGMWLESDSKEEIANIKVINSDSRIITFNEQERKIKIAYYLTEANDYISTEKIAQKLFYCNSTVIRDINQLETFFAKYDIKVVKHKSKGVKLLYNEKNLRIAKAEIIKEIYYTRESDNFLNFIQSLFTDFSIFLIDQIINEIQKSFSIFITEIGRRNLIIYIAVSISRMKSDHKVNIPFETLSYLKKKKEWLIAERIINKLVDNYNLFITEDECGNMADQLLALNLNNKNFYYYKESHESDSEIFDCLSEAFSIISKKYNFPFDKDEKLKETIFFHLKPMLNRIRNNISLVNPWITIIKEYSLYYFEIATDFGKVLSEKLDIKIGDNEIGYLALYLGGSVERILNRDDQKKEVIIVCASGTGTSQFLKERVIREFPNISVIKVLTTSQLEPFNPSIDLIISTIPIRKCSNDFVIVSPILTSEDIDKIRNKLWKSEKGTLLSFLDEKISIFQSTLTNKYDVISFLGKIMYQENYVEETFIESAIDREKLSSTEIGNFIAIPHAYQGHIKKQGIGFLQLKNPIDWCNTKVSVIFLLSIDMKSQSSFKNLFEEIQRIGEDFKLMERISNCKNFNELCSLLN